MNYVKHDILVKRDETNLDFQVSIANKTIKKKSERNQNLNAKDLSPFVQPVHHPCNLKPTWGEKLREEGQNSCRKDELSPVFKILLQKKTSDNYYTTTEILTTIERSRLV